MTNWVIDSRNVSKGDIFVALTTGILDGNDFAKFAIDAGASKVVISRDEPLIEKDKKITVPDTLEYISLLAREKFVNLKNNGVKSIAITGSIGKTTTKDLIAFLIERSGKKVFKTPGNYNNHIGLPLSILNCPDDVDFLVLEMGMNSANEISNLIKIAPCDIRIITSIDYVHTENFENEIFGVALAKCEIMQHSTNSDVLLAPCDVKCKDVIEVTQFLGVKKYVEQSCDFLFDFYLTSGFKNNISLSVCALRELCVDLPERNVTLNFKKPDGRGSSFSLKSGTIVIDDCYNASPASVFNSFESLKATFGDKKILLVLGDMKELGLKSRDLHLDVLKIGLSFATKIVTVGSSYPVCDGVDNFATSDDLLFVLKLNNFLDKFDCVLLKGSNSVNLSSVVSFLKICQ